jgi:hypothetical protein
MSFAKPQCISGTWHNDGAKISAHIRERQSQSLLAAPAKIRASRSPQEWKRLYNEAMTEKRLREKR